jgi:hypothetical protein
MDSHNANIIDELHLGFLWRHRGYEGDNPNCHAAPHGVAGHNPLGQLDEM